MYKSLRFLILIPVFQVLALLSPQKAFAEQISNYQNYIKLEKSSEIHIIEKITYDFGSVQRHGIFREIPITTLNKDGIRYALDVDVISVKIGNNQNVQYSESTSNYMLTLKIGDPNKTISGENLYTIEYTVKGAPTYFSDHDELYWNAIGTSWQVPILKSQTEVDLSDLQEVKLDPADVICFTGSYGSRAQDCAIKINANNKITITSSAPLQPYEGLTFAVSIPKGVIDVNEPQVYKGNGSSSAPTWVIVLIFLGWCLVNIIATGVAILWWYFKGRDPQDYRVLVRMYDAPKDPNSKEMTPLEMGLIVDESISSDDVSAEIIHLAVNKYLILKEDEKKKVSILRGPKLSEDLSMQNLKPHQQELIEALGLDKKESVELKNTVTSSNAIAAKIEKMKSNLYKKMTEQGYFNGNPQNIRLKFFLIGFGLIFVSLFLPGITFIILAYFMPRKTQLGVEAKRHALGLKEFLVSQERQFEFQEKNFYLFEKLLPFAISFGVAKVWAKKFEDLYNYQPDWYQSSNYNDFRTLSLYEALDRDLRKVESNYTMTSTTSSTGHSSGFSGGGSSGGGGGGGGGGSW